MVLICIETSFEATNQHEVGYNWTILYILVPFSIGIAQIECLVDVFEFVDRTTKIMDFKDPMVYFPIRKGFNFFAKNNEYSLKFKSQERTIKMQILREMIAYNAHESIGMQTKTRSIIYRNSSPQLHDYLSICVSFFIIFLVRLWFNIFV